MRALSVITAVLLAGCGQGPEPAPISSSTRFDPELFAGKWQAVERIDGAVAPCAGDWLVALNSKTISCEGIIVARDLRVTGPGRLTATDGPFAQDPIWVLWVDEDHQTAAIGTPSRSFAFVLNRGTTLRPDRRQAARDVLRFNGYDLDSLTSREAGF